MYMICYAYQRQGQGEIVQEKENGKEVEKCAASGTALSFPDG
jgi:hypothetical protein